MVHKQFKFKFKSNFGVFLIKSNLVDTIGIAKYKQTCLKVQEREGRPILFYMGICFLAWLDIELKLITDHFILNILNKQIMHYFIIAFIIALLSYQ